MAKTDANPPMPEFRDDYVLQEVDAAWLSKAVKPKQFIHIDQSECIMCEGCVDICPWKCIHMVSPGGHRRGGRHRAAGHRPDDHVIFTIDDDVCTRCACASTGAPPASSSSARSGAAPPPATPTSAPTTTATATGCGSEENPPWPRPSTTSPTPERSGQAERARPGLPGLELDLPAGFDLPEGLHRQPAEPSLRAS
jgi:ferredoxin